MNPHGDTWELARKYVEGAASLEEAERLEQALLTDVELRTAFLEYLNIDSALEAAAAGLKPETAAGVERSRVRIAPKPLRSPSVHPLAVAAALWVAVIAAAFVWFRNQTPRPLAPFATLHAGAAVKWAADSPHPKEGDALDGKPLRLEAGIAQMEFARGAVVAVQGPAEFAPTGPGSLHLTRGRASALVPARASGFAIETRDARFTDLGTRFGVRADEQTEAHVFEGRIQAEAGSVQRTVPAGRAVIVGSGGREVQEADARADGFPLPAEATPNLLSGGDFEPGAPLLKAYFPDRVAQWFGDPAAVTEAMLGVQPRSGAGMLRFLPSESPNDPARPSASAPEVWQIVDLRPWRARLASGEAEAELTAFFNRAPGSVVSARDFGVTLLAFKGRPTDAKAAWAAAKSPWAASAKGFLTADELPGTWEPASAKLRVPADAEWLLCHLYATFRDEGDGKTATYDAHFADSVSLTLHFPPRAGRN